MRPRKRTNVNDRNKEDKYMPGNKNTTSTSKTRNKRASKKNFMQKGRCAVPLGSKPHS